MTKCKRIAAPLAIALLIPGALPAAEIWGGSLAATSDYLVRGISRSNQHAALQADVHVASDSGFIGGVFASNVQFDSGDPRSAEVSAFAGFSPRLSGPWRTRVLASYYGYLWNDSGSQYNYAELAIEAAYDDWLGFDVVYSPDAPRYLASQGLVGVSSTSAEVNLRTPSRRHFAAAAGAGYSELGGAGGRGYAYWSVGGVADFGPCSISLFFVDTDAGAKKLFYSAAAHDQWTATVIWRF
ncbi:MAG TPA: TorF family putative porin [Steroidobacteraceae bacterium]|nr:TorF family putative porin [Steroidobacteraceae bacterium]